MKLKKLKFAYFQSYNQEIEINFSDLNDQLILFSGPTGSGKTTIFDAICYALFGSVSNDERSNDEIKSNYANESNVCYSELTFEIQSKEYSVYRSPAQFKIGKSNRKIKEAPKAYLSGFNLTKIEEVNQKIKELIGMNLEQFRQIVLLPQGKFQKLLFSSSDEKEKIFRSLFNTTLFSDLQNKLKAKVSEYQNELKLADSLIQRLIPKHFLNSDYNQVILNLEDIKNNLMNKLEKSSENKNKIQIEIEISNQVLKLKEILNEKQQQLEKFSKLDLSKIKQSVSNYQKYQPLFEIEKDLKTKKEKNKKQIIEINYLEEKHMQQMKMFESSKLKLENHLNNEENYNMNSQQLLLLNDQLKKYENFELLLKNKNEIQKNISNITLINEQDIENQITNLRQKLEHIQEVKNNLIKIEKDIQEWHSKKNKLIPLHIIQEYNYSIQKYKVSLENFTITSSKMHTQFERLSYIKNEYYKNLAVILSETLKHDMPCPVCGSTHHPYPAKENSIINKEALDIEEKKYRLLYNEYTKLELEMNNLNEFLNKYNETKVYQDELAHKEIDTKLDQLQRLIFNYHNEIEFENTIIQEVKNKQSKLEKIKTENLKLIEQVNKYELELALILSKLSDFSFEISKDAIILKIAEIEALNAHYSEIKNKLIKICSDYEIEIKVIELNLNKIKEEKTNLELEIKKNLELLQFEIDSKKLTYPDIDEQTYLEYLNQITSYQTNFNSLTNEIQTLKKQIDMFPILKYSLQDLKNNYQIETENYNQLHVEYSKYCSLIDEIKLLIKKYSENHEEFKIYKDLLDVAMGETSKNHNISFERYVLGYYLDCVLVFANDRLLEISDGRYYFIRDKDYKGRGKKGLEINIFDHYNGILRSVNSLSGGESFQASLCLSLGMSDYLSQKSTINYIEFLFIDEGFGSLDLDNLDIAINTLIEIAGSGKTIGIISHVEELKNRIPIQVQVKKSRTGSFIKIQK